MQSIYAVHQRMAELYTMNQRRELTIEEMDEMVMCLKANAKHVWEMAYFQNLAIMESMLPEVNWIDEKSLD